MNGLSPQSSSRRADKADETNAPAHSDRTDGAPQPTHPRRRNPAENEAVNAAVSDEPALIEQLRSGQASALERLIDLHDRAVRYTIFRVGRKQCLADPEWLDMVASEVWMGLCDSLSRSGTSPTSLRAYLVQIARNRAVTAVRRDARIRKHESTLDGRDERLSDFVSNPDDDPSDVLGQLEELAALKKCLESLDGDDRNLVSQLTAITERRWLEAGEALGIAESTLRSRWKNVLKRLEDCVTGRLGKNFAPTPGIDDSK